MVRSETPEPVGADQSLGDLVALATKDVSQLIRYEIDLAKTELRGDMKRVGLAAGLGGFSFFFGCLVLVFLGFAYGYGLIAAGVWAWAAFLIVAGTCVVFAAVAVGIAYLRVQEAVRPAPDQEDGHRGPRHAAPRVGQPPRSARTASAPGSAGDGQQTEIAVREVK